MDKNKIRKIAIPAVIIIALLVIIFNYSKEIMTNGAIKVSGNIEATEIRLSFRVNGQVEKLFTDEGMYVKENDIVATLKTDELAKIRDEYKASLKAVEYEQGLAKDDYVRAENLLAAGAIPTQKRDAAKTKADSYTAKIEQLTASLNLAETRLDFANLRCPVNSFVLVKSSEEGEVVQPGTTIFAVADLSDIWLTAYINEKDLGRVKLNQEAVVKTDTYPDKEYKGRISMISQEAEFTPKQIQTTEERVKLVYRIKIAVDNSSMELKPGMPADGYIKVKQ